MQGIRLRAGGGWASSAAVVRGAPGLANVVTASVILKFDKEEQGPEARREHWLLEHPQLLPAAEPLAPACRGTLGGKAGCRESARRACKTGTAQRPAPGLKQAGAIL